MDLTGCFHDLFLSRPTERDSAISSSGATATMVRGGGCGGDVGGGGCCYCCWSEGIFEGDGG